MMYTVLRDVSIVIAHKSRKNIDLIFKFWEVYSLTWDFYLFYIDYIVNSKASFSPYVTSVIIFNLIKK